MPKILDWETSYFLFLKRLQEKPFCFLKFGDGEWINIFKSLNHFAPSFREKQANCDSHLYFQDCGRRLLEVFLQANGDEDFLIGLWPIKGTIGKYLLPLFQEIERKGTKIQEVFVPSDFLHSNLKAGKKLEEFRDFLDSQEILLIGPEYLKKLTLSSSQLFLEIPRKNCWLAFQKTKENALKILSSFESGVVIIIFSLGANVLAFELYQGTNRKFFVLNVGAIFDPFAGEKTRPYHFGLKW
jgi:hypothetical protein